MLAAISSHKRTMQLRAGGKKFTVVVVDVLPPFPVCVEVQAAAGSVRFGAWWSVVSEFPELVMLSSVIAPSDGNAKPPFGRLFTTSFGRMCRYPPAPVVTSTECLCGPRSLFLLYTNKRLEKYFLFIYDTITNGTTVETIGKEVQKRE